MYELRCDEMEDSGVPEREVRDEDELVPELLVSSGMSEAAGGEA